MRSKPAVLTTGKRTRAVFADVRDSYGITGPPWGQECSLLSYQAGSLRQATGRPASPVPPARRVLPRRVKAAPGQRVRLDWQRSGCSLAGEILWTHKPPVQGELGNLCQRYLHRYPCSSDTSSWTRTGTYPVSRHLGLGVGVLKCGKGTSIILILHFQRRRTYSNLLYCWV